MLSRIIRLQAGVIGLSMAASVMAHGGHVPATDAASHSLLHAVTGWESVLALVAAGIAAGALVFALRRTKRSRGIHKRK